METTADETERGDAVDRLRDHMLAAAHAREMDDHHRDAVSVREVEYEENIDRPYVRVEADDGRILCVPVFEEHEDDRDDEEEQTLCDPFFYGCEVPGIPRTTLDDLIHANGFGETFIPARRTVHREGERVEDDQKQSCEKIPTAGPPDPLRWRQSPFEGPALGSIFKT